MKIDYYGNVYEAIGMEDGKVIFQCVNDDSFITITPEEGKKYKIIVSE